MEEIFLGLEKLRNENKRSTNKRRILREAYLKQPFNKRLKHISFKDNTSNIISAIRDMQVQFTLTLIMASSLINEL